MNKAGRLQAVRSVAKKQGLSFVSPWKSVQLIAVGNFVLSILLDVLPDVFTSEMQNDARVIVVTDTVRAMTSQAMRQFVGINTASDDWRVTKRALKECFFSAFLEDQGVSSVDTSGKSDAIGLSPSTTETTMTDETPRPRFMTAWMADIIGEAA
jgi:hypothetical protein